MENEQQSNRGFVLTLSFIISAFIISMIVIEYDLWPEKNNSLCEGQNQSQAVKIPDCHPHG